jgi:hypothetical protein
MDFLRWLWDGAAGFVADLLREAAGGLLGPVIVGAIALALLAPIYLVLKMMNFRGKRHTSFRDDFLEALHPPKPTAEQLETARHLEELGDEVRSIYRYLLVGGIALFTGFAFFLFLKAGQEAESNFLRFYLIVVFLLFLGWALNQLHDSRPRRKRNARITRPSEAGDSGLRFEWSLSRVPTEPQAAVLTAFAEQPIDPAMLSVAQAHAASGSDFDTICAFLNPDFRSWSPDKQASYREYVRSRLTDPPPLEEEARN